jgi:capsular polysaccharide biosynthesis protein
MFDVLPRLYLLEQAGVLDAIDLFVVPPVRSRFQQESLQILGISDSRLLVSDSPDFHVQATNLFVPSLPSLLGSVNYWASGFIRDRVLGKGLPVVPAAKRIYISRKKAGNRKLSNEDALDGWLDRNGFTTIIAESYSLLEQAAIFNTAEVVMALHGSGLSNIAFCKPGAVIIELFSSSFIVPCFWIVANNHSLKYYYLQDEHKEERPFAPYWEGVATDFALSETMLDKILQASTIP